MSELRNFMVSLADALERPENDGRMLHLVITDSLRVAIDKTWGEHRIVDTVIEDQERDR